MDRNDSNTQGTRTSLTQGGVGSHHVRNIPLLRLSTTGAKSGLPRQTTLGYIMDGDRHVVVASKRGSPTHPDWYHNLVARPDATIEVDAEQFPVRAETVSEPERARLFHAATEAFPELIDHQQNTDRVLPVVRFTRI